MPVCALVKILRLSEFPFVTNCYVLFCRFKLPGTNKPLSQLSKNSRTLEVFFPFQRGVSYFVSDFLEYRLDIPFTFSATEARNTISHTQGSVCPR